MDTTARSALLVDTIVATDVNSGARRR